MSERPRSGVPTGLLDELSSDAQEKLRRLGRVADDIDWPYEVARSDGWRAANEQYHRAQKQLGRREMQSLMTALHLRPPLPGDALQEVIVAATTLYLHTDERRVVSRIRHGELRLYSTRCPLYERFLDPRWHGLTACGCFARRRGWYDSLEGGIEEDLLMNQKWGDPVCQIAVRVKSSPVRPPSTGPSGEF